jgi:hypothetical protein
MLKSCQHSSLYDTTKFNRRVDFITTKASLLMIAEADYESVCIKTKNVRYNDPLV